ncbi:hypothetical protein [Alcanivorax sp. S71-1-4]|uniref:hypothetical protein n=1 Tax=Alcanivorax sp. S71-1-4 TaxID=1177159 RepID=UPI0013594FB9|nr:hypothetical protein [Alcanivorax sp. S71-1-4]
MTRFCLLAWLLLCGLPALTHADTPAPVMPEPGVSDRFIDTFLRLYEADPGALVRYANALRAVKPEQLQRAIDGLDTTSFTYLYPMVITAAELPALQGRSLDTLSLMAVRGGALKPIPFQFDEYDSEGLIWIDGVSRHPADGTPGRLDALDELVFMYRDGGRTRYAPDQHGPHAGTLLREIRLTSPRNDDRFVYLVADNPARSEARYVDIDLDAGTLRTTVMTLDFNPKNLANIGEVTARVGEHADENLFDTLYFSLSTGILNRNLRVNLDTRKNIRALPLGVKQGPVRASVLLRARIWYFGLPTLFNHHLHVHLYEQGAVLPVQLAVSSLGAVKYLISLLRQPEATLTVDLHQITGARTTFDSAWHERLTGVVDGEMSLYEQSLNHHRMPGDWLMLDSTRGWSLFFVNGVPITEGGLFDAFLAGSDLSMLYLDDPQASTDYQQFTGATPRLGFRARGLPQPAIDLLAAAPRMPRSVHTLGEALLYLEETARHGALDDYDRIVSNVLSDLVRSGRYASVAALTDAYVHDASRMRFTGIDEATLETIFRAAMQRAVTDPATIRHAALLSAIKAEAEVRGVNLADLRHATMDLALWFPNSPGPDGPKDFFWQVQHPPAAVITPLTQLSHRD